MAKDEVSFQVININLKSRERKGEDAYTEIIKTLFKNKVHEKVAADRSAILRTQNRSVFGKYVVYYGSIGKFTTIGSKDWLNIKNMEKESFEIPANLFPNLKETYYVFVPELHRMAIVNSSKFSITVAHKFLSKAVLQTLKTGEKIDVIVEQDINQFKEILLAKVIKRLEMEITYSNADLTEDYEKAMDDQLRKAHVGKMKTVVTPDSNDSIELKESPVLDGITRLSGSNGYVKATILTDGNRRKNINTKNHPLRLKARILEDNIFKSIVNKIADVFKRNPPNK